MIFSGLANIELEKRTSLSVGSSDFISLNAAGQKISKTVSSVNTNNTVKHVEYLDGFQYTGGELNFFPHAEGYVNVVLGTTGNRIYNYVYNYTDHLGNIRLSYTKDMVDNKLKIMDENHYYPFGLKHQKYTAAGSIGLKAIDESTARPGYATSTPYAYKYNGQEWQDELGLNMYDMDMRQYDPAIARWVVMDPVIHHSMSPYNSFDNNPVFWADPSGADSVFESGGTEVASVTNMSTGTTISAGGADGGDNGDPEKAKPASKPQGKMENQGITSMTEDGEIVLSTPGDESTFTKWVGVHGKEYASRMEAYRAWQSEPNYHSGESWWDKTFRSMGYASMEARRDFASGGMNMYGGYGRTISAAEKLLVSQGVSKADRLQILSSFEKGTVSVQTAGNSTFGLRFYDNVNAFEKGRYLFPTFTNSINRNGLALPYNWNQMTNITQWQITPGTPFIYGRAASQGSLPGGANQMFVPNLSNLVK